MIMSGKPITSLTSGLLARKGEARPAMRPQRAADAGDDLGWNDMGEPCPPALAEHQVPVEAVAPAPVEIPPLVAARIARELADSLGEAASEGAKAAFTLRLDAYRHLRLRLASAATNRSAQQIVTAALDAYLDTMPEVEALVRRLPAAAR